jgi:hypothetical protein
MNIKLLPLLLFSLAMLGCDTNNDDNTRTMMTTPFTIEVGMNPQEYNQRNQLHVNKNINKQPAGLNFYEKDWSIQNQGTVKVDHGQYSFIIPHVLGLAGTENTRHLEKGIKKFSVRSGITPGEFINHDQARLQFMQTLHDLITLGWQPYTEFHAEPRLLGKQSFAYTLKTYGYAPDPNYIPTLDEWMALDSGQNWVFHANDVFMSISVQRNSQFMDKEGEGVYLLTYTLLTREALAQNFFQGDDRERWQELWVEDTKKIKLMRYQTEVELIKQGYHINTDYVEPKFHTDDPVEPDSDEAKALLDFIQNNN